MPLLHRVTTLDNCLFQHSFNFKRYTSIAIVFTKYTKYKFVNQINTAKIFKAFEKNFSAYKTWILFIITN